MGKKKSNKSRGEGHGESRTPSQAPKRKAQPWHLPKKKRRLSPEAIELSARLKDLSNKKQLEEALRLYNDPENRDIRDPHHACIVIDCCARCGCIEEAEKVMQEYEKKGPANVEMCTALLKGFCHAGLMSKSEDMIDKMMKHKAASFRPNIRTVNTFLRGCLWSAATFDQDKERLVGGVVSAEQLWKGIESKKLFDVSSYEYSIALLCQTLDLDGATRRFSEMKEAFGWNDSDLRSNDFLTLGESVAIACLALAKAFAMSGKREEAVGYANEVLRVVRESQDSSASTAEPDLSHRSTRVEGGKKSWKKETPDEMEANNRRSESNAIFRRHRMDTLRSEASHLINWLDHGQTVPFRYLARRLISRLLVFHGGGTTGADSLKSGSDDNLSDGKAGRFELVNTLVSCFGLSVPIKELCGDLKIEHLARGVPINSKGCNRILASAGLQGGVFRQNGRVDFARIFSIGLGATDAKKKSSKRPLDVELGAGFGEWACKYALENPDRDIVAVEMRADRVGSIFSRSLFALPKAVENLCVVGADAGSFLRHRVKGQSVSMIFVNHPEPPTQTFGAEFEAMESKQLEIHLDRPNGEPSHMLHSQNLICAGKCLRRGRECRLMIVTDNRWYGRLICLTLAKVLKSHPELLEGVKPTDAPQELNVDEEFGHGSGEVVLYRKDPGSKPRTNEGTSYFDRLWQRGAGKHAQRQTRYVVLASRRREQGGTTNQEK